MKQNKSSSVSLYTQYAHTDNAKTTILNRCNVYHFHYLSLHVIKLTCVIIITKINADICHRQNKKWTELPGEANLAEPKPAFFLTASGGDAIGFKKKSDCM